jgi:hypothetical protein
MSDCPACGGRLKHVCPDCGGKGFGLGAAGPYLGYVTVERVRTDIAGPALKHSYRFAIDKEVPCVTVLYTRLHWRLRSREPDAEADRFWDRDFVIDIDVEDVPADVVLDAAEAYEARAKARDRAAPEEAVDE